MHIEDLFLTFGAENPDFTNADLRHEFDLLGQRQQAISACLDGELPPDVLLDLLAQHCIEPAEYIENVEGNLKFTSNLLGNPLR